MENKNNNSEEYSEEYSESNTTGTTVTDNSKCNIYCIPLDKNNSNRNNKRCNIVPSFAPPFMSISPPVLFKALFYAEKGIQTFCVLS